MSVSAEYLEAQVLTASPHRLHLMVVDGAIRFAMQGRAAMQTQRWEEMERGLSRSRDCVSELLGGLDASHAPELVAELKSLFLFAYRNLMLANVEHDPRRIDDAVRILQQHRDTWQELEARLPRETAAQAAPPSAIPAPLGRSWVT